MAAVLLILALVVYEKTVPCLFAATFHVPCPGCGSTRAVIALLHGDLHGVLRSNPFGPVVAVLLALVGTQAFASVATHGDLRDVLEGRVGRALVGAFLVVAVLEVGLWIARFAGAFGGPVAV